MKNYHDLISYILAHGQRRNDRTGTGAIGIFDARLTFDLQDGYPLLTTKKVHFNSVIAELCMFLNGYNTLDYLHQYKCTIWDEWADENGNLGRIYGVQWRRWRAYDNTAIDQLAAVVKELKENPFSRRHLVSAWNVGELHQMALPPCHYAFQFYVREDGFAHPLDMKVHMRSVDVFLGLPFNIASYAALLQYVALICQYDVGRLIMDLGDTHIYLNHIDQCKELLQRNPDKYSLPRLEILPPYTLEMGAVHPHQFVLVGYESYPAIKAPIAV